MREASPGKKQDRSRGSGPLGRRSGKTYELYPESGALMSIERLQVSLGCSPTYRARGLMILPVSYCSMA